MPIHTPHAALALPSAIKQTTLHTNGAHTAYLGHHLHVDGLVGLYTQYQLIGLGGFEETTGHLTELNANLCAINDE